MRDFAGEQQTKRVIHGAAAGPSQAGGERRGGKPAAAAMVTDRKHTGDLSWNAGGPQGLERQSTLSSVIRGNFKQRSFPTNRPHDQRRHYPGASR
jgi:hypothetical protein